jgi:hypothetical protein
VSVSIASGGGQAAQAWFLAPQLGPEPAVRWQRQARVFDKPYAPSRDPDALALEDLGRAGMRQRSKEVS